MKLLISIIVVLPYVLGQIIIRHCPQLNAVKNFDVSRYVGRWYEQEKYPVIFEIGGKCVTADYSSKPDGTVKVVNKMLNTFLNKTLQITGSAKLVSDIGEGKLSVTFNTPVTVESPYWVLDTDYDNYSVVFACQEILGIGGSTMWILTRDPNPSDDYIQKAYKAIDDKSLSRTFLTKTDQKNCKY